MEPATTTTPRWLAARRAGLSAGTILAAIGVEAAPVPVEKIAQVLGVPVELTSKPGWSGALYVNEADAKVTIWLRAEDTPLRQRFTLAHELGHLLLRHDSPVRDESGGGMIFRDTTYFGSPNEAAANTFAAQLLMPRAWVRTYGGMFNWDIAAMAQAFEVSPEAMRIRVDSINLGRP